MKQADLERLATGELIWELARRKGVLAVSAGETGDLSVRTAGPALALIFPGMSMREQEP